jgi:hypothetical protein
LTHFVPQRQTFPDICGRLFGFFQPLSHGPVRLEQRIALTRERLKKAEEAAANVGEGLSLRDEMRQRWSALIEEFEA